MIQTLIGGTHNGERISHDSGYPFVKMIKKKKTPRSFFKYTPGEPILPEKFETETYTLRQFAFRHHGLWCKTQAYVLEGISDEEAVKQLNSLDSQQDW